MTKHHVCLSVCFVKQRWWGPNSGLCDAKLTVYKVELFLQSPAGAFEIKKNTYHVETTVGSVVTSVGGIQHESRYMGKPQKPGASKVLDLLAAGQEWVLQ